MATKKVTNKVTSKQAAKPLTGLAAAKALAHGITTVALMPKAATPKAALVAPTKGAVAQAAAASMARFNYQQKVVANPKATAHKGFFGSVVTLAKKPITLQALIAAVAAGNKFTSAKPPLYVSKVRVRHAFTRMGLLVNAK